MINPLSFEAMLKDMPLHQAFYIRGVLNSLIPEFMDAGDRVISEQNISGETIELMRGMVSDLVPNADELPDGFVGTFDYEDINKKYGLSNLMRREGFDVKNFEEDIKTSLGTFRIHKENGKLVIKDTYDFPQIGQWKEYSDLKTFMDYYDAAREDSGKTDYFAARFIGERIMNDGMSNNLAIRIELPDNEQVVDMDYDDPLDPEAETFVFEGPMTNKRKTMWDKFSSMFVSEAKAGQVDDFVPLGLSPQQTRDFYENYTKQLIRDGKAVPAMSSAQIPLSDDTDTSFLDN